MMRPTFTWFIALRYLRSDRTQTLLALAAVAVGVSVVTFLSALMGSLQHTLVEKTLGSQPHITVSVPEEIPRMLASTQGNHFVGHDLQKATQRLRAIDGWQALATELERIPGIVGSSPAILGSGFAERGSVRKPILVRGIDVERPLTIDVRSKMKAGHFELNGTNIVVGDVLARDLGVGVGERVRLVTSEGVSEFVTISGIFSLGMKGVDGALVFASIREAQTLYALPGGITSLELRVSDVFQAETSAEEVRRRAPVTAESWMSLNAELLTGLSAQKSSQFIIQFFVMLAVALGIASVLIVSVARKSREIGILKAVGTPARRIILIFLIQGAVLGVVGSVVGSGLGALFAVAFSKLLRGPDGEAKFPIELGAGLFLTASALACVVGILSALLPALRASRLDPATAIRNG